MKDYAITIIYILLSIVAVCSVLVNLKLWTSVKGQVKRKKAKVKVTAATSFDKATNRV